MSFLRSRRETGRLPVGYGTAPAVNGARDNILDQVPLHQHIKSQPPVFFRSKPRDIEKTFRKTLRDVGNSHILYRPAKDASLRVKARKVSSSLKNKLKSFFNLARGDEEEVKLPRQLFMPTKSKGRAGPNQRSPR